MRFTSVDHLTSGRAIGGSSRVQDRFGAVEILVVLAGGDQDREPAFCAS